MAIVFTTEKIKFNLKNKLKLRNWLKEIALTENKSIGQLTYVFSDDLFLLDLNLKYLNHDYYTDIITFDYFEKKLNGDIFISIERIIENSNELAISFENELHRIIVHGLLHLIGYKDKTEKDKTLMTQKEDYYLKLLESSFINEI